MGQRSRQSTQVTKKRCREKKMDMKRSGLRERRGRDIFVSSLKSIEVLSIELAGGSVVVRWGSGMKLFVSFRGEFAMLVSALTIFGKSITNRRIAVVNEIRFAYRGLYFHYLSCRLFP